MSTELPLPLCSSVGCYRTAETGPHELYCLEHFELAKKLLGDDFTWKQWLEFSVTPKWMEKK